MFHLTCMISFNGMLGLKSEEENKFSWKDSLQAYRMTGTFLLNTIFQELLRENIKRVASLFCYCSQIFFFFEIRPIMRYNN